MHINNLITRVAEIEINTIMFVYIVVVFNWILLFKFKILYYYKIK